MKDFTVNKRTRELREWDEIQAPTTKGNDRQMQ